MTRIVRALLGALLACGFIVLSAPAQAAEGRFTSFTLEWQTWAPFENEPCIGENLVVTQTQHTLYDFVDYHTITTVQGTAVGQTTGNTYRLNYVEHSRAASNFTGFTSRYNVMWLGTDGGGKFFSTLVVTILVNPDGTATGEYTQTFRCV